MSKFARGTRYERGLTGNLQGSLGYFFCCYPGQREG